MVEGFPVKPSVCDECGECTNRAFDGDVIETLHKAVGLFETAS